MVYHTLQAQVTYIATEFEYFEVKIAKCVCYFFRLYRILQIFKEVRFKPQLPHTCSI
jgi:hypothetical protein